MKIIKKECQIVLLFHSRNSGSITQNRHTGKLSYGSSPSSADNRHLYILSDDKIKEGDWCLYNLGLTFGKEPRRVIKYTYSQDGKTVNGYEFENGKKGSKSESKKIIATTNPDISIDKECELYRTYSESYKHMLPTISGEFLQEYVKNPVDKVLVDYEEINKDWSKETKMIMEGYGDNPKNFQNTFFQPKVSSDNTISISFIEDDWEDIKEEIYENVIDKLRTESLTSIIEYLKENYNPPTKKN